MASARVLVVEDRPNMLRLLTRILKREHHVVACGDALRARARLEAEEFDLLLTDVRMPKLSGMDLLRIAKRAHPHTEVILLTAYGDIPQSVEAMKEGAYQYLTKPFEPDELLVFVKKALEHRELVRQAEYLQHEIEEKFSFANIIGRSEAIRRAVDLVHKAAASDSTVLLLGESGTGKELFAREQDRQINGLMPDALRPLLQHDWPGNVRELQNVLERAVVLETGEKISADVIRGCLEGALRGEPGASVLADLPYREALAVAQRDATIRYLAALLRRCKGNVTMAADQAGIERASLHRLLGKVGLKASDFRE